MASSCHMPSRKRGCLPPSRGIDTANALPRATPRGDPGVPTPVRHRGRAGAAREGAGAGPGRADRAHAPGRKIIPQLRADP